MKKSVFTKKQFRYIYPDGIEIHYWNHARNAIIYNYIAENRLQTENILEIGCGRGIVVKYLLDQGISCTGVELSSIEPIAGLTDNIYTQTDAFDLPTEIRKDFSVVLLLDVIEHIKKPNHFIKSIIYSFPNLKHIIITTPARNELWTNYDEFARHYKRYNLGDLKHLNEENLSFVKGKYFNHILYPVFLFYARLVRHREIAIKAPKGILVQIHRFLSWILQMDDRLVPGYWPGTSSMALYNITQMQDHNKQFS